MNSVAAQKGNQKGD